MTNLEFRPGVDTNLLVYRYGQHIGWIQKTTGSWMFLTAHYYYAPEALREIADRLDELNAKKGQTNE